MVSCHALVHGLVLQTKIVDQRHEQRKPKGRYEGASAATPRRVSLGLARVVAARSQDGPPTEQRQHHHCPLRSEPPLPSDKYKGEHGSEHQARDDPAVGPGVLSALCPIAVVSAATAQIRAAPTHAPFKAEDEGARPAEDERHADPVA